MFCVLYRFDVKPGMESRFVEQWTLVTRMLRKGGSHGSRLHSESKHVYVAYAQWPDRYTWEAASPTDSAFLKARDAMSDCCVSIQTVAELAPIVDLLEHMP